MDTEEGEDTDPLSLHKYLYSDGNPVRRTDPSGHDAGEEMAAVGIGAEIDATEMQSASLALRVMSTLQNLGVGATVLGTASAMVPEFQNLANAFEENEGIVVQLQSELFAIRQLGNIATSRGLWWGVQLFSSSQEALESLALNSSYNNASQIVFGVIPQDAQLIMGYCSSQGALAGGAFQIYNYANVLITQALEVY